MFNKQDKYKILRNFIAKEYEIRLLDLDARAAFGYARANWPRKVVVLTVDAADEVQISVQQPEPFTEYRGRCQNRGRDGALLLHGARMGSPYVMRSEVVGHALSSIRTPIVCR